MELHKKFYTRYILLEEILVKFMCPHPAKGRCNSVFSKILLIVMCRHLLHGIVQNFMWKIRTVKDDIYIISVIIPHWGHYNCVSLKIYVIVKTWLLLHGITQNLMYDMFIIRYWIHAVCVK